MWTRRRFFMAASAALAVCACSDSGSPTEPAAGIRDIAGVWVGSIPAGPCADWSDVTFTLRQEAGIVEGEAVNGMGGRWTITGTVYAEPPACCNEVAVLSVSNLPGDSTCASYVLLVSRFDIGSRGRVVALAGSLQGRCCGSKFGDFRLTRRD
jgi:hypothetical protein